MSDDLSVSLLAGDGNANDGDRRETRMQREINSFQQGQLYLNIENLNKQAKKGEDGLCKLCEYLSKLPELCLGPCSAFSACLSIILLLLYLIGIIWLYVYNMYELSYIDIDGESQSATIIFNNDCSQESCLSNQYVCQYYGFQDCENAVNQYEITQFDLSSEILIKIEYFIAWFMWVRLRFIMKDISIVSVTYLFLVILSNLISYMFRHLGWIYYSKSCKILYSPYFSDTFVKAIISFIVSFVIWLILAMICLKRKNGRLVLRWKGDVKNVQQNGGRGRGRGVSRSRVDNWSVCANVTISLFFFYTTAAPALWIGIDNYQLKVQAAINSSSSGVNHWKSWITVCELMITTIVQYFLPKIQWVSVYLFASMVTNLLLIVDVVTFILKLIRDSVKKYEKWRDEKQKE